MSSDACQDVSLRSARVVSLGNGQQLLVFNQDAPAPAQPWLASASDGQPVLVTPVRGQMIESCDAAGGIYVHPSDDGLKRVLTVDDEPRQAPLPSAWKLEDPRTPAAYPGTWWPEALPGDLALARLSLEECHRHASASEEGQRARYGQPYRKSCVRLTPKERNRLAQKRFRDRQKALIAGLQCKVEDLSALVRQYQVQTATLQRERLDLVSELRKRGVAWPGRHC